MDYSKLSEAELEALREKLNAEIAERKAQFVAAGKELAARGESARKAARKAELENELKELEA